MVPSGAMCCSTLGELAQMQGGVSVAPAGVERVAVARGGDVAAISTPIVGRVEGSDTAGGELGLTMPVVRRELRLELGAW